MSEHQQINRERKEKPDNKKRRRINAEQLPRDHGSGPGFDFSFNSPPERHDDLLVKLHSHIQRANFLMLLQQTHSNRYVQRLIKPIALQAKLAVSTPGDIYEQEADRVAERVMCDSEYDGLLKLKRKEESVINSSGEAREANLLRRIHRTENIEIQLKKFAIGSTELPTKEDYYFTIATVVGESSPAGPLAEKGGIAMVIKKRVENGKGKETFKYVILNTGIYGNPSKSSLAKLAELYLLYLDENKTCDLGEFKKLVDDAKISKGDKEYLKSESGFLMFVKKIKDAKIAMDYVLDEKKDFVLEADSSKRLEAFVKRSIPSLPEKYKPPGKVIAELVELYLSDPKIGKGEKVELLEYEKMVDTANKKAELKLKTEEMAWLKSSYGFDLFKSYVQKVQGEPINKTLAIVAQEATWWGGEMDMWDKSWKLHKHGTEVMNGELVFVVCQEFGGTYFLEKASSISDEEQKKKAVNQSKKFVCKQLFSKSKKKVEIIITTNPKCADYLEQPKTQGSQPKGTKK